MRPDERELLKQYIEKLDEKQLWKLLVEYFGNLDLKADVVHSTGEHGMDVVAFIDPRSDVLGTGCNVVIQAKKGQLGLTEWREVLYQLLEAPYYRITHPDYSQHLARRVVLAISGSATLEARNSIQEFNNKHEVTVELWEINDLLRLFGRNEFAAWKLQQITGVGRGVLPAERPPAVGQPD